jgi:hypothetical protein
VTTKAKKEPAEKLKVTSGLHMKSYPVLVRAIEEGMAYGWRRAHKYLENPSEEAIKEQLLQGILNEICEYFDFDKPDPV